MFSEACGAIGPLRLEWEDRATGATGSAEFRDPAVVVGRGPGADLRLDHEQVGLRHAYLQVIEGRLFAVDLGSRAGLRWDGVPRTSGWLDPGRPVEAGPFEIRVVEGFDPEADRGAGPAPTSSRYLPRGPLADAVLEIHGPDHEAAPERLAMDRALRLIGSSGACQPRFDHPGVSRFACAIVRTAKGLWAVDLKSTQGIRVNGVRVRQCRLEDGDRLGIGPVLLRPAYHARAAHRGAGLPAPTTPTGTAPLLPELFLPFLEGEGPPPEGISPLAEAMLSLIRLVGDVHRDHLALVRSELEQIRRVSRQIEVLRTGPVGAGDSLAPTSEPAPEAARAGGDPTLVEPTSGRPDPGEVHLLVGERLAAWERERQGRWRKVLDLLSGN